MLRKFRKQCSFPPDNKDGNCLETSFLLDLEKHFTGKTCLGLKVFEKYEYPNIQPNTALGASFSQINWE